MVSVVRTNTLLVQSIQEELVRQVPIDGFSTAVEILSNLTGKLATMPIVKLVKPFKVPPINRVEVVLRVTEGSLIDFVLKQVNFSSGLRGGTPDLLPVGAIYGHGGCILSTVVTIT